MKILSAVMLVLTLGFATCCTRRDEVIESAYQTNNKNCQLACTNLKRLHCEEGNNIVMHETCSSNAECKVNEECSNVSKHCETTCVQFCIDTLREGVNLEPLCVAKIDTCSKIETCQKKHAKYK